MTDWFKETAPIFPDEKTDHKKIHIFLSDTGYTPFPIPSEIKLKKY